VLLPILGPHLKKKKSKIKKERKRENTKKNEKTILEKNIYQ
jgi:hypothetical protein